MILRKSLTWITLTTMLLLAIPLVAMQFTREVVWTLSDFVVAGALLFGTGLTYVLVASQRRPMAYKLAAAIAATASLLLVWGNLAVGFIGSEDNPVNLLYGVVLAVGFIGAVAAKLQPQGMAKAMFGAALTQFAVPFVALLIKQPELTMGVLWVIVLNTVFAGLWVAAGLLFRRAAGASEEQGRPVA
ncbi:hypothetical protein [Hymenobacter yonginensis]|uniref:DUF308 domain-containing protein n=1 Tax=Hymenobacter yonginensis TaxID=748197 RepID=A0ABY7PNA5_9BACT|nr:hypothetical protein [Hymenobacter yonginensis]WBO84740.1 hypothetical protein O9Z63_00515 [Hymenobacter yonginensis]